MPSTSSSSQSPNVLMVSPVIRTRMPGTRRTSRIGGLLGGVAGARPRREAPADHRPEPGAGRAGGRVGQPLEERLHEVIDLLQEGAELVGGGPAEALDRSFGRAPLRRVARLPRTSGLERL